jgi:hypothetical protein
MAVAAVPRGVGDVLLDAAQDCVDQAAGQHVAARRPGDGRRLAERAIRDGAGTYWSSPNTARTRRCCHPGTSWMQGAPGIAAFLLRLARVLEEGLSAPVIDRRISGGPSARLRTVHTGLRPRRTGIAP